MAGWHWMGFKLLSNPNQWDFIRNSVKFQARGALQVLVELRFIPGDSCLLCWAPSSAWGQKEQPGIPKFPPSASVPGGKEGLCWLNQFQFPPWTITKLLVGPGAGTALRTLQADFPFLFFFPFVFMDLEGNSSAFHPERDPRWHCKGSLQSFNNKVDKTLNDGVKIQL